MPAAGDKLDTFANTISNITPITSVENTIAGSKSDLPGTSYGSRATGTVVVAPGIPAKRLIPDLASWLVFCPVHGHRRHQTPRKDDFPVNVHGINCKAEPKIQVAIKGHLRP